MYRNAREICRFRYKLSDYPEAVYLQNETFVYFGPNVVSDVDNPNGYINALIKEASIFNIALIEDHIENLYRKGPDGSTNWKCEEINQEIECFDDYVLVCNIYCSKCYGSRITECGECVQGYYLEDHTCKECFQNCAECTQSSN